MQTALDTDAILDSSQPALDRLADAVEREDWEYVERTLEALFTALDRRASDGQGHPVVAFSGPPLAEAP